MTKRMTATASCVLAALALSSPCLADDLAVVSVSPAGLAQRDADIVITFDRAVDPASVNDQTFWAFARSSGAVTGAYSFSAGNTVVSLSPDKDFFAGEHVMVILSHDLVALDGSPMRDAGYSFKFVARAAASHGKFNHLDTLTTRTTPSQPTIAYGGVPTDLNEDGFCDIAIVNEETADVRVFLNSGNGLGNLLPFMKPTNAVQQQASPSDTADFDRDGNIDMCVVNIATDRLSILKGNGDGTFDPQVVLIAGDLPRGVAILDADGDGDQDIVCSNANSSNMALFKNDGAGNFAAATFFNAGSGGEWGLATADMNSDGILDLVVGARFSSLVYVMRGNGDGTFTTISERSCGGQVWMLKAGDLDGDGDADVVVANSQSNNAAVMFNDGAGNLSVPTVHSGQSFAIATDIGDVDGDGDADWINSCYGSGQWRLYKNNGSGVFTLDRVFDAPGAGSCAQIVDLSGDHRMDLSLVDEIDDIVELHIATCYADCDENGATDFFDFLCFQNAFAGAAPLADCDGNGSLDFFDFLCFQNEFAAGCP